ncbi:sterol desaturase family protein [Sphingomonas sp. OTU376]|uniref:sterol desaturase family protein n=1 Tax=Sphingomonas sp. OTU376 TaxID=3043863 RepID=UPI00313AAC89
MLALILAELAWRLGRNRGYDGRAALTTLGLVAGGLPFAALNAFVLGTMFEAASRLALWQLPLADWRTWGLGFLAVEFAYYWFHRASHRIRWMWASHAVHHSAEQLTLLSSFRLGWTNLLSAGWIFYVPLVLLGLPPAGVFVLLAANLRYQFFLHTEAVGRLGPIEWVFNTPAHHRLHHASNDCYIDRNYGGVLILFDRLFGTLAREVEGEAIRYGLAHRAPSYNVPGIALSEWWGMARDAVRMRGLDQVVRALFGPPGAVADTGHSFTQPKS